MSGVTRAAIVLLAGLAAGCAAIDQTFDPPDVGNLVYIGTRSDWQYLSGQCQAPVDVATCHAVDALAWPFVLVDLPFTIVGDTLLLPYTLVESR